MVLVNGLMENNMIYELWEDGDYCISEVIDNRLSEFIMMNREEHAKIRREDRDAANNHIWGKLLQEHKENHQDIYFFRFIKDNITIQKSYNEITDMFQVEIKFKGE